MDKSTVTLRNGEISVEVTLDEIAEALGQEYIMDLDRDEQGFTYISALALETYDDEEYDIERVLMEFIRNEQSLSLDADDCDEIEAILR